MAVMPAILGVGGFCFEYVLLGREDNIKIYTTAIASGILGMILLNLIEFK